MKHINSYINEAWSGVKKQTNNAEITAWCDEMDIKKYTINDKGEIDVNGGVDLGGKNFKELPYKFGKVGGYFILSSCENLISLKNCPNEIGGNFFCNRCKSLNSLEGCPKEVAQNFFCDRCKREFTKEEVKSLCKVKRNIVV